MKNIDVVNKIIASQHNIDERIVKLTNNFYWKALRSKMVNAESTAIGVKGLCTFPISRYNLYKNISSLISKIRYLRVTTKYKETTLKKMLETNTLRLQILLKRRNEIAKDYYDKRISKTNS